MKNSELEDTYLNLLVAVKETELGKVMRYGCITIEF